MPNLTEQQLIESMSNPSLIALGEAGTENFSPTATADAHRIARRLMDNLNNPQLLDTIFDPTLTQEELAKVNDRLKTTIISNPNLP